MKRLIIILIIMSSFVIGQISSFIPEERVVDWTKAGLKDQITAQSLEDNEVFTKSQKVVLLK
jgi:uncharacterized membrane protein YraQ (UPF0718 family)